MIHLQKARRWHIWFAREWCIDVIDRSTAPIRPQVQRVLRCCTACLIREKLLSGAALKLSRSDTIDWWFLRWCSTFEDLQATRRNVFEGCFVQNIGVREKFYLKKSTFLNSMGFVCFLFGNIVFSIYNFFMMEYGTVLCEFPFWQSNMLEITATNKYFLIKFHIRV